MIKSSSIIFAGMIFLGFTSISFADITDSGNGILQGTFTVVGNAFSVGGSTLAVKNGNVGIGSSNPGAPLSVKDTNAPAAGTYIQTAVGSYIGWDYLSGTSASKRWAIRNDGATYGDFQIVTESGNQGTGLNTTRLYINGSGNVGIGTTNPGNPLVVNPGNSPSVFNGITVTSGTTNAMGAQVLVDGNDAATFNGASVGFTSNLPGALWIGPNQNARITVLNSGNIGIGTTNPAYRLDVSSWVNASGMYSVAGFFTTSDAAFKENVKPLGNVLEKIANIQAVSFEWNAKMKEMERASEGKQIGLIAQEVEKEFPELISKWHVPASYRQVPETVNIKGKKVIRENKVPDKWGDFRSLDYGRFTTVLLEAIKEQQKEIEDLKTRIATLEKK